MEKASPPTLNVEARAISFPVSRSVMERPVVYVAVSGTASSERRRTSILRSVRACQKAGSTRDWKGANWTIGMRMGYG